VYAAILAPGSRLSPDDSYGTRKLVSATVLAKFRDQVTV